MAFDSAPSPWVLKDIGDRLAAAQKLHDQLGTGGNVYGNPQLQLLNEQQVYQLDPELRQRALGLRELNIGQDRLQSFKDAAAMDSYEGPDLDNLSKLAELLAKQDKEYNARKRATAIFQGYR